MGIAGLPSGEGKDGGRQRDGGGHGAALFGEKIYITAPRLRGWPTRRSRS